MLFNSFQMMKCFFFIFDNKRLISNEPCVVIVFAIIDKGIILQLFQSSYLAVLEGSDNWVKIS